MYPQSVFFTVVYPQALEYIHDVRNSLLAQTCKEFDVLIVNDGCDKDKIIEIFQPLKVTVLDADGGFTNNRTQGINYARRKGYKYILFSDADDSFTANRCERTIDEFNHSDADIIVCNLNIANEECKPILNEYFSLEIQSDRWIDVEYLMTKNIFGMSNTALCLDKLTSDIQLPETPIVDWLLFSSLLLKGMTARYISDSLVNYRQYNNNLIGINRFDVASFRRFAKLKANHYKLMLGLGFNQYNYLLQLCESIQNLQDEEISNILRREISIHPQPLWWQIITNK